MTKSELVDENSRLRSQVAVLNEALLMAMKEPARPSNIPDWYDNRTLPNYPLPGTRTVD